VRAGGGPTNPRNPSKRPVFLCRQAAAWTAGVAWRRRWGAAKTFNSDMNAMSFVIGRRRPGQLARAVGGAGGFFIVSTTLKAIELLSNRHPLCLAGGGLGSWRGLAAALGERLFMGLDASQLYADALMGELAAEVENGRLLRLVSRLSAVTERPEHEGDPQWSETGAPAASPCCLVVCTSCASRPHVWLLRAADCHRQKLGGSRGRCTLSEWLPRDQRPSSFMLPSWSMAVAQLPTRGSSLCAPALSTTLLACCLPVAANASASELPLVSWPGAQATGTY